MWVGAWGAAMTNATPSDDNAGGSDQTFRFLVNPTLGGTMARVRFSNVYGTTPVTLGSAHLGIGQDGSPAVDAAHDAALTFNNQPSVTLAPGQVITSDPVALTFAYGQSLAVTLFLKGSFGPVSRHNSLFVTNYRGTSGSGDKTGDVSGSGLTETTTEWLLLNGIDVYGQYEGTLAMFGSSTTDGYHSNYGSTAVYPVANTPVVGQHMNRLSDLMAARLHAAGHQIGVVNEGVPGDTVTADISNQQNNVRNANDRFAQDVLSLPNLIGIVSYFGSIDLRSAGCESAPAMEAATTQLVAKASAAKIPVVLATLPPSAFCLNPSQANYGPAPTSSSPYAGGANPGPENGAEVQRAVFNAWLRQNAVSLPGVAAIADFDYALADPNNLSFMLPLYNSGDNYHPNGEGYKAEAGSVPLAFLP